MRKNYLYKVLLFVDIFFCALIFRDPDVTISAEVGLAMERAKPPVWAQILNWVLNKIQANHCATAILDDIARAQTAIEYLKLKQP
jgi:hypothetical protein